MWHVQTVHQGVLRGQYNLSHAVAYLETTLTFKQLNMPILMYDKDGKSVTMTLEQLLPMSFGPEKLLTTEDVANGAVA